MSKRIVGYVISHSGKPGGPWERSRGEWGSAADRKDRMVWCEHVRAHVLWALTLVRRIHPAARMLRLVRRERHRAEEAAVVEAALAFVAAPVFDMTVLLDLTTACAALRAKRGG